MPAPPEDPPLPHVDPEVQKILYHDWDQAFTLTAYYVQARETWMKAQLPSTVVIRLLESAIAEVRFRRLVAAHSEPTPQEREEQLKAQAKASADYVREMMQQVVPFMEDLMRGRKPDRKLTEEEQEQLRQAFERMGMKAPDLTKDEKKDEEGA